MASRSKTLPEREVVGLWQQRLAQGQALTTTAGQRLKVVYPGRASGGDGPDFRDAVLVLGGERQLKGDIELHVRPGQWLEHGHHLCPSYDNVVLHVVLWDDGAVPALLPDTGPAPVLALGTPTFEKETAPTMALPCHNAGQRWDTPRLQEALVEEGQARFRDKASRFQRRLKQEGADQALYEGLLEALGYSKNKEPFLKLARALPWRELRAAAQATREPVDQDSWFHLGTLLGRRVPRPSPDFNHCDPGLGFEPSPGSQQPSLNRSERTLPEAPPDGLANICHPALVLQALLLGAAGLLPGQQQTRGAMPDDPWVEALESAWRHLKPGHPMPELTFRRDRIRPENLPARRLAGAGLLLARYLDTGLASNMTELAARAGTAGPHPRLEAELTVAADGFWASHLDFGIEAKGDAPALIGQGRAGDVVVNAMLPFVWAWAGSNGRPALQVKALELYRNQPKLQDNSITRHMMLQLAIGGRVITSAAQQQGLLHIYKAYCTQGACARCRLSPA